jgi:hypothetical protein
MSEKEQIVIIATNELGTALLRVFSKAPTEEEITIQYSKRFGGTVELILRMLREGAGWREIDRGEKLVINQKCIFNKGGCTNKEKLLEENLGPKNCFKCLDSIRNNCKHYQQQNKKGFTVQYVTIQVIGQVRSLRK